MMASRYSTIAAGLHWATALAVLAMIPMGWWMKQAITTQETQQAAYQLYQVHKSIGFVILGLTVLRLAWRLTHRVPPLARDTPAWQRFAAHATHWAFYALLFLLPVTGWIFVSAGWSVAYDRPLAVATSWFGLFQIPHLPQVAEAAVDARRSVAISAANAHSVLAWGVVVLVGLHVTAALKHQFVDRDGTLATMIPWLRRGEIGAAGREPVSMAAAASGIAVVIALGAVASFAVATSGRPSIPDPTAAKTESTPAAVITNLEAVEPAAASEWTIDSAASSIAFSGAHAGNTFEGRFTSWAGRIWFDPADLAGSKAVIVVRTASARTGDATQEGTLTEEEWFDIRRHPEARFETSSFQSSGGNRYTAAGTLSIKARALPVILPFTLALDGDRAVAKGSIELDRTALDLGMFSDPAAEWVTEQIGVSIEVFAKRADPAR